MKKFLASLVVLSVLLAASGCSFQSFRLYSLQDEAALSTPKDIDESKLVYIKEQRIYKYSDEILFTKTYRKIRTKEEALGHLRSMLASEKSGATEKASEITGIIYSVPLLIVAIPVGIAAAIYMLPASPLFNYQHKKEAERSFNHYRGGAAMLTDAKHEQARESFLRALRKAPAMIQQSDIYYRIAETYEGQGDRDAALRYYQLFLDHSIALYPEYFARFDATYQNDLATLDRKFTRAEEKLSAAGSKKSTERSF